MREPPRPGLERNPSHEQTAAIRLGGPQEAGAAESATSSRSSAIKILNLEFSQNIWISVVSRKITGPTPPTWQPCGHWATRPSRWGRSNMIHPAPPRHALCTTGAAAPPHQGTGRLTLHPAHLTCPISPGPWQQKCRFTDPVLAFYNWATL